MGSIEKVSGYEEKFKSLQWTLDTKASSKELDDLYEKLLVSDMTSLEQRINSRTEMSIDKLSSAFKTHIENILGNPSQEKSK